VPAVAHEFREDIVQAAMIQLMGPVERRGGKERAFVDLPGEDGPDQELAELQQALRSLHESAGDCSECPGAGTLWESAAGRLEVAAERSIVEHLARCTACGQGGSWLPRSTRTSPAAPAPGAPGAGARPEEPTRPNPNSPPGGAQKIVSARCVKDGVP
jgi:hypothetical protein